MIRIASQLTFCSPEKILRNNVLEIDDQKRIRKYFCLDNCSVEPPSTIFYNGILSTEILSLKQNFNELTLQEITKEYRYIDVDLISNTFEILTTKKPLIIDFGTNLTAEINLKMKGLNSLMINFSIIEIIAACVYFPAKILGVPDLLTQNYPSQLLLWENIDLAKKKITNFTQIKEIDMLK